MGKINLAPTTVESREQRLGTIIGWDGKASKLVEESGYSARRCNGKKGVGCELCEIKGPFTQGSVCSEQMVECQAGNVRDAVLIQHSPIGCAVSQTIYNSIYRNGLAIRGLPVENLRIVSTNLKEGDMVFGGVEKLAQTIRDAWERYKPNTIFIGTACATGIIGDDVDSVAGEYSKKFGIPVVPLHCEGFRSKHWSTGFDTTQHGILRDIVRKNPKKQEDLVNVINLWGSDVFTPMLKELNLRVNYVIDMATVEDLAQMSEAAVTVGFCNTLSSYLAQGLEQNFGVPELKAPQPYGFAGTDAWLRGLAKITHREELCEAYIKRERERVTLKVEALRKKLKGIKGYVATGSAYSHGLIAVLGESSYNLAITKFLVNQLGLIPVKQIITENPPEEYKDSIRKEFANIAEDVSVIPLFLEDGYLVEQALINSEEKPAIILGTSWDRDASKQLGGNIVEIGFPASYEVILSRANVGYKGALSLLEKIFTIAISASA